MQNRVLSIKQGSKPSPMRFPVIHDKLAAGIALLIAFCSAFFYILYPSYYTIPLVFGAALSLVFIAACIRKPLLAAYAALVFVLIPIGMFIPNSIHSILNRVLTITAAVGCVFTVLRNRERFLWPASASFFAAFIVWGGISLFWAAAPGAGTTLIQRYILRLVLFFLILPNLVRTRSALEGVMKSMALTGWIVIGASLAIIAMQGYTPGSRFSPGQSNANDLGLTLVIAMIGVLWYSHKLRQKNKSVAYISTAMYLALTGAIIGMSGSRGGAMSFLIILAVLGLWRSTRLWSKIGLALIIISVLLFPSIFMIVFERFAVTAGDTMLGGREVLWERGAGLLLENPILGIGIGNISHAMIDRFNINASVVSLHNPLLVIWSETGIIGIVLYVGILLSAVWSFIRSWRSCRKYGLSWLEPYFFIVTAVMAGFMISWIKGGGMESAHSIFLMLFIMLIPSVLLRQQARHSANSDPGLATASG